MVLSFIWNWSSIRWRALMEFWRDKVLKKETIDLGISAFRTALILLHDWWKVFEDLGSQMRQWLLHRGKTRIYVNFFWLMLDVITAILMEFWVYIIPKILILISITYIFYGKVLLLNRGIELFMNVSGWWAERTLGDVKKTFLRLGAF